jgi:hypothetical protein
MAFDYKLVKKNEKTALSHYEVLETNTDQVIRKFPVDKQPEARAFMRSLNLGAGFNGYTPSFFLTDVEKHITTD